MLYIQRDLVSRCVLYSNVKEKRCTTVTRLDFWRTHTTYIKILLSLNFFNFSNLLRVIILPISVRQ